MFFSLTCSPFDDNISTIQFHQSDRHFTGCLSRYLLTLTRHGGFCWSTFVCAITLLNVFCDLSSLASRHRKRFSSFYSYFVELVVLNYEIRFKN